MALLKNIRTSITAILLIATLMITVTTSIQPVFAPRGCGSCITQFEKLTRSFGADAGKIILSSHSSHLSVRATKPSVHSSTIMAVYDGQGSPPEIRVIPNLVSKYGDDWRNSIRLLK